MTLEDKITNFLHTEWVAGNAAKKGSVERAQMYMENIWDTISDNPNEGFTVDGLIKSSLVSFVDAYANDEDLTDALEKIIKAEKGAA